jgi:hypothetical protein
MGYNHNNIIQGIRKLRAGHACFHRQTSVTWNDLTCMNLVVEVWNIQRQWCIILHENIVVIVNKHVHVGSSLMLWVRILFRARCTTLCDKVCQWLAVGRWFSPVSSTNKTDHHNITEILLKMALNTITLTLTLFATGNL